MPFILGQNVSRRQSSGKGGALLAGIFLIAGVARGQDPVESLPGNYRHLYENQMVRVIRVTYRPHEKLVAHNHPDRPTVYVYLNDSGRVRFSHIEEHEFALIRPAETKGTFRVSPGRVERNMRSRIWAMSLPNSFASSSNKFRWVSRTTRFEARKSLTFRAMD